MTWPELHERLLSWATAEPRRERLLRARADHFDRWGEPHEEERSFEQRMSAMLDAYLFDWREEDGKSTLDLFVEAEGGALAPGDLAALRALGANRHGLFEVRRVEAGRVRVRDAFSGEDLDVTERRHAAGLDKGDLLEARLMPFDGSYWFSSGFIYHPREARKAVLAEVKRLRKAAGKDGRPDVAAFLATLSRMAFKLERYRNVRLESIYDFTGEARTLTPRPGRP